MRDLIEQRGKVSAAMRQLCDHPEGDGGDLSEEQQRRFDEYKTQLEALEKRIERQSILDAADRSANGVVLAQGGDDRFEQQCRQFSLCRAIAAQIEPRAANAGREVEIAQELARRSGRTPQGMFVPLNSLVETRVQTTGGDAGNLVAVEHLSSEFIDALRPATVVGQLGGRILTGMRGDISIPKMDEYTPTVEWIAENAALTSGDHSFTAVTASPKHAGLLTEWSRKVLLQADPAIESLVRSDFTQKLAAGVDQAVMHGTGAGDNMPQGIIGTSGVGTASGLTDYATVVDIVAQVEAADVPMASLGWAGSGYLKAKLRKTLRTAADTSSNFVMGDSNQLVGYPFATSSQFGGLPVGSPSQTEAIFGAWNQVISLFWGDAGADILVNPYAATPYSKGNVQIRALVDCDVVVRHAAAFVHWTNIQLS